MSYQLISFELCPYVQRSVITLTQKQVDCKVVTIDLERPPAWFLDLSPLGKVPVLRVNGTVLFESAVINEYLDEVHPPSYHPRDPLLRAHHRAWIEFGSHLLGRQYRLLTVSDGQKFHREREDLAKELPHLERQLGDGPLFNGPAFSLVDAAYAPLWLRFALMERCYPLGLFDRLPRLERWREALLALPSVQASVPPDFEARFYRRFAEAGGYFGQFLAAA